MSRIYKRVMEGTDLVEVEVDIGSFGLTLEVPVPGQKYTRDITIKPEGRGLVITADSPIGVHPLASNQIEVFIDTD